jgi:hypothetical protein
MIPCSGFLVVRYGGRYASRERSIVTSSLTVFQIHHHPLSPHKLCFAKTIATFNMARNAPSKLPYRHKGSRSSASSRGTRNRNSQRTSGSITDSGRSSVRSASTVRAGPSRPSVQFHRGPFPGTTSAHTPLTSHREERDENDETLNEIIMAVDMTPRGTVGCCYYVARDEKLYFMEDIQFGDAEVVDSREPNDDQVESRC